jgi:ABC-2 type transport system ATP-binding protein
VSTLSRRQVEKPSNTATFDFPLPTSGFRLPTSDSDVPLLDATDVSHSYGASPALRDVSLTVWAGELVALVGRNGAGKSTLLRLLAAWTRSSGGGIRVCGRDVRRDERAVREHVVLVPDTPRFYDELTAWEHLQFVANAHRKSGWQEEGERLLRYTGLWAQRDAFPLTYSRGMRYKLALCMALLVGPDLLLLDEPFGPLDPVSADRVWTRLEASRDRGMGILLSTHQLPPGATPDRYIVMEEGELIAAGTPDELRGALDIDDLSLDTLLRAALDESDEAEDDPYADA